MDVVDRARIDGGGDWGRRGDKAPRRLTLLPLRSLGRATSSSSSCFLLREDIAKIDIGTCNRRGECGFLMIGGGI